MYWNLNADQRNRRSAVSNERRCGVEETALRDATRYRSWTHSTGYVFIQKLHKNHQQLYRLHKTLATVDFLSSRSIAIFAPKSNMWRALVCRNGDAFDRINKLFWCHNESDGGSPRRNIKWTKWARWHLAKRVLLLWAHVWSFAANFTLSPFFYCKKRPRWRVHELVTFARVCGVM